MVWICCHPELALPGVFTLLCCWNGGLGGSEGARGGGKMVGGVVLAYGMDAGSSVGLLWMAASRREEGVRSPRITERSV